MPCCQYPKNVEPPYLVGAPTINVFSFFKLHRCTVHIRCILTSWAAEQDGVNFLKKNPDLQIQALTDVPRVKCQHGVHVQMCFYLCIYIESHMMYIRLSSSKNMQKYSQNLCIFCVRARFILALFKFTR